MIRISESHRRIEHQCRMASYLDIEIFAMNQMTLSLGTYDNRLEDYRRHLVDLRDRTYEGCISRADREAIREPVGAEHHGNGDACEQQVADATEDASSDHDEQGRQTCDQDPGASLGREAGRSHVHGGSHLSTAASLTVAGPPPSGTLGS